MGLVWGPYVPDIKPKNLPGHVLSTKPDIIVVVSDYGFIMDVKHISEQLRNFKDLFSQVAKEKSKRGSGS